MSSDMMIEIPTQQYPFNTILVFHPPTVLQQIFSEHPTIVSLFILEQLHAAAALAQAVLVPPVCHHCGCHRSIGHTVCRHVTFVPALSTHGTDIRVSMKIAIPKWPAVCHQRQWSSADGDQDPMRWHTIATVIFFLFWFLSSKIVVFGFVTRTIRADNFAIPNWIFWLANVKEGVSAIRVEHFYCFFHIVCCISFSLHWQISSSALNFFRSW